ncbi:flavin reductase family protein [Variovorax sp. YR216]|uniref:flavin reductase family protein n=1 Tax=Variovorax sp. YR216 TaxID=1882828 RepID=UPI00089B34BF|nr:flavin reductase family protein [Variovorax sp. YR216]SEB05429.1 NADH-FMN oxidoreductase RutF, flavin reductase (DIM6/NTAB) family [Variovorax sp. YR216]
MTRSRIYPAALRATMRRLASGVTVVTFRCGGEAAGMTANSFLSVSLDPALVLVSVRKGSRFAGHVNVGHRYGVSILGDAQQALSAHFGGRRDDTLDVEFDHVDDIPLIADSLAQLTARVTDVHPAGDHLLYIAEVEHLRCGCDAPPLLFQGGAYRRMHPAPTHVHWQPGDGW